VDENNTVYYVRTIDFDIKGRTRPFALMYHGELTIGEEIIGRENVKKYIDHKTQLLVNQRALDSVTIDFSLGEVETDGPDLGQRIPLDLLIHVKDTWNVVAIPRPQYDTNDGLDVTLKVRDYNFFGTMNPLRIDFGYALKKEDEWDGKKGSFNFMIDSDTPFKALGLNWNVNFDHYFGYTYQEPLYYKNITGISVELPWKFTTFTVGLNEYVIVNEENEDRYKDYEENGRKIYDPYFYGPYMATELFGSWKIPLGVQVGGFGELT
jgi:outer membrane protein assembly factor BamA